MATLKEELRVDPLVQEVIFLPPKVKRSECLFFFLEENVQPSLCFLLSCGKFCRLRGCDPIKRAKFRLIYACDVGV